MLSEDQMRQSLRALHGQKDQLTQEFQRRLGQIEGQEYVLKTMLGELPTGDAPAPDAGDGYAAQANAHDGTAGDDYQPDAGEPAPEGNRGHVAQVTRRRTAEAQGG